MEDRELVLRRREGRGVWLRSKSWWYAPGDYWVLIGRNGVGKSAFLKALCGFGAFVLDQGRVFGAGEFVYVESEALAGVDGSLRAEDVMRLIAKLTRREFNARVDRLTHGFGLSRDLIDGARRGKRLSEFSSGERQLLVIASTVLSEAKCFVFDEAFSSLDPIQEELGVLLAKEAAGRVAKIGGALMLASHDREFINRMSSKMSGVLEPRLGIVSQGTLYSKPWDGSRISMDEFLELYGTGRVP